MFCSPDRSSPCDSHPLSFQSCNCGTDLQITNLKVKTQTSDTVLLPERIHWECAIPAGHHLPPVSQHDFRVIGLRPSPLPSSIKLHQISGHQTGASSDCPQFERIRPLSRPQLPFTISHDERGQFLLTDKPPLCCLAPLRLLSKIFT